jgi:hypothetical protein
MPDSTSDRRASGYLSSTRRAMYVVPPTLLSMWTVLRVAVDDAGRLVGVDAGAVHGLHHVLRALDRHHQVRVVVPVQRLPLTRLQPAGTAPTNWLGTKGFAESA